METTQGGDARRAGEPGDPLPDLRRITARVRKNSQKAFGFLRENRGDFLRQPKTGDVEIVADGRSDWNPVAFDLEPM
jgi:hypothetical protein